MLGKFVRVQITRPIGYKDEKGYIYPLNFGRIYSKPKVGAFVIGPEHHIKTFDGRVVAVLNEKEGFGRILIVAPKNAKPLNIDIEKYINLGKDFPDYKLQCLYEHSCGAVVFHEMDGKIKYLLIKNNRSPYWAFPKGHVEQGETMQETAIREVREETGLNVKILPGFQTVSIYKVRSSTNKKVWFFVAKALSTDVSIQKEEIYKYQWLDYSGTVKALHFENDKHTIIMAHRYLIQNRLIKE